MTPNTYHLLPKELGDHAGLSVRPTETDMPKPTPEMLQRMEEDRRQAEERRPIADLFQPGTYQSSQLTMGYRLYVPEGMEPGKHYPLVLFLHGAGERGNDNISQLTAYEAPLVWVRDQLDGSGEKCFVLAPQCPDEELGYWLEPELLAVFGILNQVTEVYSVDENRLYLTGMSMGGGGCWRMNYMFPERFAAVVPVCSAGGLRSGQLDLVAVGQAADALYGKKLWMFHAADDFVVTPETSRSLVRALEQRGQICGVDFFYTEYPEEFGYNHGAWTPAYENRLMRQWLFQQTLAPAVPFGPPMGPDGEPMAPPPEMEDAFKREKERVVIRRRDYVPRFQSHTVNSHGICMNYRLYVPGAAAGKLPMVVMLHGIGECGVNTTEPLTANDGALDWVKAQDAGTLEPCMVLVPQCPNPILNLKWEEEYLAVVEQIIQQILEIQSVDEDRIYVAGLSLGGYGAWNISRMYPERYAAVVSCCPACLVGTMFENHMDETGLTSCAQHLKDKPLWMFHAEDDPAVPVAVTREMNEQLNALHGAATHHMTIYPAEQHLGHGSWEKAFKDYDMMRWLMEQHR